MTWQDMVYRSWPGFVAFPIYSLGHAFGGIPQLALGTVAGGLMGYGMARAYWLGKQAGQTLRFYGGPLDGTTSLSVIPDRVVELDMDGQPVGGEYQFVGLDGIWRPYSE